MTPLPTASLQFAALREAYASGAMTPTRLVELIDQRITAYADPAVFIHRPPLDELWEQARRLEGLDPAALPLYGVPFAIKDNIDLAGAPTSAGCPEFAYRPATSAPVVDRLLAAGALPVGKTNLDQFATGLVGTRSPHGTPRNPYHPEVIPGGSSSGSACAVAAGLVNFALGTDTAGSGRVPAALQNLVGVKPTRGWLSTRGVVPACRSLDCVSVFAQTVADALRATEIAAGFDAADPFSREQPGAPADAGMAGVTFRFGVPPPEQLEWFGDTLNPPLFTAAIAVMERLGGTAVVVDFTPFRDAARLLYDGPWVAERWAAIRAFHAQHAHAIWPVTRRIIEGGAGLLAVDAFEASYRLAELRRQVDQTWQSIDLLLLPTAPTVYTRAQVAADPITLNSRLGTYTNFANLLDTAAVAVPAGFRADGVPFGVTLFGPAWSDVRLATIASRFQRATTEGALAGARSLSEAGRVEPEKPTSTIASEEIAVAVVGAHLRGQPLNGQLTAHGGRFLRSAHTADCYRLYALSGTTPAKPGLVRVAAGRGAAIELEIWSLPSAAWARFVAAIPPPLGLGTIQLADKTDVKGFICEPIAIDGAVDISRYGGWRAYLARTG